MDIVELFTCSYFKSFFYVCLDFLDRQALDVTEIPDDRFTENSNNMAVVYLMLS